MTIPGVPSNVLVAPDAFKGTFAAGEVAAAIARGLEARGRPADLCPIADGGEGTLEVLAAALGAEIHQAAVEDPLGRPVQAEWGLLRAGETLGSGDGSSRARAGALARIGVGGRGHRGTTAVVEAAQASGLDLVAAAERDPLGATTRGTGQLIVAAIDAGAETVLLGVGGTATTDGGSGAIRAIRAAGGLRQTRLTVLCDVQTPFEDAAVVFGPQKGADRDQVRQLTRRLEGIARRLPRDPRRVPMTGAAGGLAGGLWAAFGAELRAGAPAVLDALGFDVRMRAARAVVTGEGKLDRQSLAGKALSEVATRARQAGVPCHAVVGSRALGPFEARILDLQGILGASTLAQIEAAGRRLAEVL
ncbi:MAG: glycerate kinase [Solirubrobacterales bacterium]|nr:glycerate kinase [Solirubrobacterales bacterium]